MHILLLNWKDIKNPDVGGAEIILYELAKRLIRQGHCVTWFCRQFPNGSANDSYDGISVIRRGGKLSVYWQAFRYYQSLSVKPDVVIDCVNTLCWQTPLYVPYEKRIAYVNQLAGDVFWYELPWGLSHLAYLLEPLEYLSYRNTRFLCYSESVKNDLGSIGIPTSNISTFPIGIDQKRYPKGTKSKTPLFVFVARLTRMKRPDVCIEAFRAVITHAPKAKLAIVGYGPMENTLRRMIARLGLGRNVFLVDKDHLFFDTHPKDQKVKLMQQAWALLLPSVKEGWGMVVTEAASCGTPSIVTNVTGLVDSVTDKRTGIILSKHCSAHELADAMIRLIDDGALRNKLSSGAYTASKKFTWERSYRSFVSFLENS